jgi:hypothetical protein
MPPFAIGGDISSKLGFSAYPGIKIVIIFILEASLKWVRIIAKGNTDS